jgi:hypothetical protein
MDGKATNALDLTLPQPVLVVWGEAIEMRLNQRSYRFDIPAYPEVTWLRCPNVTQPSQPAGARMTASHPTEPIPAAIANGRCGA